MNVPLNMEVNTGHLRESYVKDDLSFGNPDSDRIICLVGSCRVTPLLNNLRALNALNGGEYEILCFNPVEMWDGPGSKISDCVNRRMRDYRFGEVEVLICESLKFCGVLNTLPEEEENVFTTLGCDPRNMYRIPNWHFMHIYHEEVSVYDAEYAAMQDGDKVIRLRAKTEEYKEMFLDRCRRSSFSELESWTKEMWREKRLGWTSEHISRTLSWKFFELIMNALEIPITHELKNHHLCLSDPYSVDGTKLTDIDYWANNWEF